jgi:lipoprotein-anchoring transpeptidase ErfK/SrfK
MPPRIVLLLVGILLVLAAPAAAQDPVPPPAEERIGPGVRAGGVDLSGLTVEEAAARLDRRLAPRLMRRVVVRASNRRFSIGGRRARVRLWSKTTARRALKAGRGRTEGMAPLSVRPAVTLNSRAVAAFARNVRRAVARRARNARVRITLTRLFLRRARVGRTIDAGALTSRLRRVLASPTARRAVRQRIRKVFPPLNANDMRRRYGTVVTIDRRTRNLRLFKRLRHRRTYDIAVGMAGFETPRGFFRIRNKRVNPAWTAPNRPWAGSYAGRTVPGGAPDNPLKARWLGITGAVGIHGTAEEWTVGTRASHGCIRMRVRDVIDLYRRVPVGTRVLIR